jgi:ABC-type multidrug transport system ATPase subunit
MRVELQDVRKSYPLPGGSGTVAVLDGVDLVIESGSLCVIRGSSGSGKTTLLSIIGGLAQPTSGSVRLAGEAGEIGDHRCQGAIAFGFQEPVFIPELTVMENLLLPAFRCRDCSVVAQAEQLLEAVGLAEMFDLFPAAMSGGEKRRLNLARALILPPSLLLLDEPAVYLDEAWRGKTMELVMGKVRDARATLMIASHDPVPGTEGFRHFTMDRGKVSEDGIRDY